MIISRFSFRVIAVIGMAAAFIILALRILLVFLKTGEMDINFFQQSSWGSYVTSLIFIFFPILIFFELKKKLISIKLNKEIIEIRKPFGQPTIFYLDDLISVKETAHVAKYSQVYCELKLDFGQERFCISEFYIKNYNEFRSVLLNEGKDMDD